MKTIPQDPPPIPANEASPPPSSRRGTVLIIEPDANLARTLEAQLTKDGFDVLVAETGHGGQYLADQQQIDLVLLDRNLTDASSIELLRDLRSSPNPCEVIVTTVDPTVEIFVESLEAGAFDLLAKPFRHPKLVTAKVNNAVSKVRAERTRDAQSPDIQRREAPAAPAVDETPDNHPTTRLPNQAAADIRFTEETSRALRYNRPLTVALLSIDKLGAVHETIGDTAADAVWHRM
ncbi:MAG: response regulator, partial [Myxococcota bacterium]